MNKVEVARRQIGMATWLFLEGHDPVAVMCLAAGAAEVLGEIGIAQNQDTYLKFRESRELYEVPFPQLKAQRNRFWNAMKHFNKRDGIQRDDNKLLLGFNDINNDEIIFSVWWDYKEITGKIPIEGKLFMDWYVCRKDQESFPDYNRIELYQIFPKINVRSRVKQEQMLRDAITNARCAENHANDATIEHRSLIAEPTF